MLTAADAAEVGAAALAVRGGRRFAFSLSLLCIFPFSSLLLPFSSLPSLLSSLGLLPLFSLLFSSPSQNGGKGSKAHSKGGRVRKRTT